MVGKLRAWSTKLSTRTLADCPTAAFTVSREALKPSLRYKWAARNSSNGVVYGAKVEELQLIKYSIAMSGVNLLHSLGVTIAYASVGCGSIEPTKYNLNALKSMNDQFFR